MAPSASTPQNIAERLISASIGGTWLFWATGTLYFVGPVLGWALGAMALREWYFGRSQLSLTGPSAYREVALLAWLMGMSFLLLILILGHINFELGLAKTVKSSVGWAKGWALLGLFPLAGAMLEIRVEIISRAICKLAIQGFGLLPLFVLAPVLGLPGTLWISPLSFLGGSGPEFFAVTLYTIDPSSGFPRWQFFAPWSPAAGIAAIVFLVVASTEKNLNWRLVGYAFWLLVVLMSQSRLALVLLLVIPAMAIAMRMISDIRIIPVIAISVFLLGIFGSPILDGMDQLTNEFRSARADSSRVRETLARIAIDRWQQEAFWFGHGIVENGPHLVEYMPIGSHHSWYGLLFVKGLTGFLALLIPLALTLLSLFKDASSDKRFIAPLAIMFVILAASFGENLEVIAYLIWPGLVVIGTKLRSREGSQISREAS